MSVLRITRLTGINEDVYNDGNFLPNTHGFDYVGTILPFTLSWNCDTSKVKLGR